MTTREKTIARLERSKRELYSDLRNAGRHMHGSEWWTDRVDELERTNRWLIQMGAAPDHVVMA